MSDVEAQLTGEIIGAAAIEVHRHLGPGLLESAYEECLCLELELRGLSFKRQTQIPVQYKTLALDCGYRADVVVGEKVIIELKTVEKLQGVHKAQLLTYLKLTGMTVGLLLNFNVPVLKEGIVRLIL